MDLYVVREPGQLLTGYNCDHKANMFHSGTIFCDAASKVIYDENQISLVAGKTIMSKLCFKEFLWEQSPDCVNNYHNNNGFF